MQSTMLLDSLWVLVTRLGNRASNFLIFLLLARALPIADFGVYGYVVSTTMVLSVVCDLGLRQSSASFVGRGGDDQAAIVTHLALAWLVLGSCAGVAGWLVVGSAGQADAPVSTAVLAGLAAASMLLIRMGQGLFLGLGQIKNLNQSEFVSRAVMLSATAGLWLLGLLDLHTALWILFLAHLAAGSWLCFQLRERFSPAALFDLELAKRMLGHGLIFASGIMVMILMGRVGIWIVDALLDPAALGVYFGILRLAEMLVEVATAVGVVIFSHGVRAADAHIAAREAIRVARCVLAVMATVAVVAALVATPLLTILVGGEFAAQATGFRIMLVGAVASCLTMMLYPNLSSKGHARWGVVIFLPGLATAAIGAWIGTTELGIVGACMAISLANVVTAATLVLVYRHIFGFPARMLLLPQRADIAAAFGKLRGLLHRLPFMPRPGHS